MQNFIISIYVWLQIHTFGIILNSSIICTQFSKKGIFTFGSITGNDVPKLWSKYQSNISYIPTISFKKNVSNQSILDFEWGYQLQGDFSGDSLYKTIQETLSVLDTLFKRKIRGSTGSAKNYIWSNPNSSPSFMV